METFFLLFALVFLPFLWIIRSALRYTKETVGADSPLCRERTYQFTALQYFSDFERIMNVLLVLVMLVAAYRLAALAFVQDPRLFVLALLFVFFAGLFGFSLYFDWQYWTITRDVQVTFNPFQPSLTVDAPFQHSVLTPDKVVRIEQHSKKTNSGRHPLAPYGYYLFYCADGTVTPVNNIFFSHVGHFEFLERFFPAATRTIVDHQLPWVTDINQTVNAEPSNFDTQN